MNPRLRLLGAAASHGLLTGQIVFSTSFVGACELPNRIHAPRQVNACLERWMTVSALFSPPGAVRCRKQPEGSGAWPAGGVAMSSSIPASAYVEHFDPELGHHRAWQLAVLQGLVAHDPKALEVGGTLRRLWTEHQQTASSATESQQPTRPKPLSEDSSAVLRSAQTQPGNPLSVPWFSQLDSHTDQARRMCFSSSCAMLLAFLRPGCPEL